MKWMKWHEWNGMEWMNERTNDRSITRLTKTFQSTLLLRFCIWIRGALTWFRANAEQYPAVSFWKLLAIGYAAPRNGSKNSAGPHDLPSDYHGFWGFGPYGSRKLPGRFVWPVHKLTLLYYYMFTSSYWLNCRSLFQTIGESCAHSYYQDYGLIHLPPPSTFRGSSIVDCRWNFTVKHGDTILITFHDFSVEDASNCSQGYVEVNCMMLIANAEGDKGDHETIWAMSWENLFMPYANNKGADQPAYPRSLISALLFAA